MKELNPGKKLLLNKESIQKLSEPTLNEVKGGLDIFRLITTIFKIPSCYVCQAGK